jgi:hypothetical protein
VKVDRSTPWRARPSGRSDDEVPAYASCMAQKSRAEGNESTEVADLLNRGVESLALLLELVSVLSAKGILTEEEVGAMGRRAEQRRVEILEGTLPS